MIGFTRFLIFVAQTLGGGGGPSGGWNSPDCVGFGCHLRVGVRKVAPGSAEILSTLDQRIGLTEQQDINRQHGPSARY